MRSSSAPPDDEGPDAVLEDFLDRDDLAGDLRRAGEDDVEALVEHDLGADLQLEVVDLGVQRHLHLAPAREHVDVPSSFLPTTTP